MGIRITTALLDALNTTIRTTFYESFEGTTSWASRVVASEPSDSESNTYPLVIDPGAVREWTAGERAVKSLELGSYQIFNKRYEKTLGINRDQVADDKTGALVMKARSLGAKFKKHPDRRVTQIILENPTGLDGVALFHASHERNPAAPDGNVYSNLFTGKPLTPGNFAAVRSSMLALVGPDGEPLDVNPTLLMVSPKLEYQALKIVNAEYIPNAAGTAMESNVLRGIAEVLVVPQLATSAGGADDTWYLLDVSTQDRPIIMQPREALEVQAFFDPRDPQVFMRNEFVWGGTIRYGFGPGSPYRIAKCTP